MAPRANWKGYLKLSLVSCAVALYPASRTSGRIAFHTLNRRTGNRLRRQMFDPDTGEVIEVEDQAKGYEIAKGDNVVVDDEELDAIALESTHTIDIETFVPRAEIDEVYLDSPYYLVPDDKVAQEAFSVIREAMRQRGMVGLARVVLFRRERIVMLEPRGKGLFVATLRYPYEVRLDDAYFGDIPETAIDPGMLDLAGHIIGKMAGHFDPGTFHDRYEEALAELVRSKQKGEPVTPHEAPRPANVVNLMDALRRSVGGEQAGMADSAAEKRPARAGDGKSGQRQRSRPAEPESRPTSKAARKPARKSARLKKAV